MSLPCKYYIKQTKSNNGLGNQHWSFNWFIHTEIKKNMDFHMDCTYLKKTRFLSFFRNFTAKHCLGMDSAYVKMVKKTFKTLLIKMPIEVKSEIYNQTISNTKWNFYCTLGSSQKNLFSQLPFFVLKETTRIKKNQYFLKRILLKNNVNGHYILNSWLTYNLLNRIFLEFL